MMNIRVTGQTQSDNAIGYMRRQQAALATLNDQISSGVRLKAPSDDPANFPALTLAKAAGLRFDAYTQTMNDATADLSEAADSLGEANQVLVRAKQIAVEAVNGTTDSQGHEALATEVDTLITRMLSAANKQADGNYLFGGTATDTPPFATTGTGPNGGPGAVVYQGSADRARVLIGPGQTTDTRYVGSEVFQQAGGDAFGALIGLRDALRSPNPDKAGTLTQSLAAVDAARTAISDTTAEQSANLASLEALKTRVTDLKLATTIRAGDLESTDYAEAIVKLQEQQGALQATLAVTAKLMEPSLLNFIQ